MPEAILSDQCIVDTMKNDPATHRITDRYSKGTVSMDAMVPHLIANVLCGFFRQRCNMPSSGLEGVNAGDTCHPPSLLFHWKIIIIRV